MQRLLPSSNDRFSHLFSAFVSTPFVTSMADYHHLMGNASSYPFYNNVPLYSNTPPMYINAPSYNAPPYEDTGLKRKAYDYQPSFPPIYSHSVPEPEPLPEPDFKRTKLYEEEIGAETYESEEEEDVPNPFAVSNFRISDVLVKQLKAKGIESLFPIQALTFDTIYEGNDLVGRARTGQGKTLAFVLPILESLTQSETFKSQRRQNGRAPSVLVLAPTRELAKQVHDDFEFYGSIVGLSTVCLYGGAPYAPQESALRRGVDVVVGTPGRIKDHLERGTLNLKTLKFRVLDEADEMLNMGFVDDVERILGHVEDVSTVQTLLFSATMPDWVKQIASKFFKPTKEVVDLVGDEKMKACATVRHLLLPCVRSARPQLVSDVISCYSSGGRTIVFTERKNEASDLASTLPGTARALHGDIPQGQREVTLGGFRSGKFSVLVATDVAARGLDITDVQLIIQCEPPKASETYIHRSGRTGRAGKTGISVMFFDRKKEGLVSMIEKKAGFKFERIAAPQPSDIARASASSAAESINGVSDSLLPIFRPAAEELVRSSTLSPTDIIAKAIAKIAGHTQLRRRSLITGQDTSATMMLQIGKPMYTATFAFNALRKVLSEDVVGKVKGMSLTKDNLGAVFDIPTELVDEVIAAAHAGRLSITVLDVLPELQAQPDRNPSQGRGGGHVGRGGGGGRGAGGRAGNAGSFGRGAYGRGAFGGSGSRPGRGASASGNFGNTFAPGPAGRGSGGGNPNTVPLGRGGFHVGHATTPWRGGRGGRGRGPNM